MTVKPYVPVGTREVLAHEHLHLRGERLHMGGRWDLVSCRLCWGHNERMMHTGRGHTWRTPNMETMVWNMMRRKKSPMMFLADCCESVCHCSEWGEWYRVRRDETPPYGSIT